MRNLLIVSLAILAPVYSQAPPPAGATSGRSVPIFHVTVIERTLKAVNYQRRAGPTRIDMKGTVLLPKAEGDVAVEVKSGYTELNASFRRIEPPTQFGTEYLSYVVWAITPDGRAINLGEMIPDGSNKAKMRVTCPFSTFGLLVTAEPYLSVPYPSDVVVMENSVRPDTIGRVEDIEAKAELLPRGQYTMHIKPKDLASASMRQDTGVSMPEYEAILALYEARNAVQIAQADGAAQYAADSIAKAQQLLSEAEGYYARKTDFDNVTTTAHRAVQAASDARVIALRRGAPAVR